MTRHHRSLGQAGEGEDLPKGLSLESTGLQVARTSAQRPADFYWAERPRPLPQEILDAQRKAVRLEWWTIGLMSSVVAVTVAASGSSQAMKAAWIEDVLSLIPATAFIVAMRIRKLPANARFPFGHGRSLSIAFLAAATALLILGAYLFIDSATHLIKQESVTIPSIEVFGRRIWQGWLMLAAVVYSALPPTILGRKKQALAEKLHEKTLYTDAVMMKDDWLTATATGLGVLGIAAGFSWSDALAGIVVSIQILWDGQAHFRQAVAVLADRKPRDTDLRRDDPLNEEVFQAVLRYEGVRHAVVRLREQGDRMGGEVHVWGDEGLDLVAMSRALLAVSWRLREVIVVRAYDNVEYVPQGGSSISD